MVGDKRRRSRCDGRQLDPACLDLLIAPQVGDPDGNFFQKLECDSGRLLNSSMGKKPVFIRVWDGKVGLNIRDISRWKWDESGHLDVTVPDGSSDPQQILPCLTVNRIIGKVM